MDSIANKTVLTVSELNNTAQRLLEGNFPNVWVEGEISNLSRPTSGHWYFSLKDQKAQVRCALFRTRSLGVQFEPRNGLLVQVQAKASIYPDRGDYQLIVDKMELAGDGLLRKAYEELVKKLTAEGLFQEQWKKPLPTLPKQIGVISSPTGAAIRDILSVLKRRFPSIPVFLYPTKVQGAEAAPEIVKALQMANQHNIVDVLIVARGGGSLEDLWPFNEEIVARAIFASKIPIITGVGHEIDFTVADFVADKRAPTPSAAAELIVPVQTALWQQFVMYEDRIKNEILKQLQYQNQRLDWLLKRLRHPGEQIQNQFQRLSHLQKRLTLVMQQNLKNNYADFKSLIRALEAVSPLATLSRGYAIVTKSNGGIIRSIEEVQKNEALQIKLLDGIIKAVVS
jgi:exodeoxyribonuclease VII large subunit